MTSPGGRSTLKDKARDFAVSVITDPRTVEAIKDILGSVIAERILPLLPLTQAAAIKATVEKIGERVDGLDGKVDGRVDLEATFEAGRSALDRALPDVHIPLIGNLKDFWRLR